MYSSGAENYSAKHPDSIHAFDYSISTKNITTRANTAIKIISFIQNQTNRQP